MPPTSPDPAPSRSAEELAVERVAELNERIRALLERTRRRLSDAEKAEYEQLLRDYDAAKRDAMTTAA